MSDPCDNCNNCCEETCIGQEIQCVYSCGCCCTIEIRLAPNLNLSAGTILAQRQSDGMWLAYDPQATGAQSGLQFPRGVLRYDTITDANGAIANFRSVWNIACPPLTTSMYVCGTFRLQETTGNLAAALAHEGFGRLVEGFVGGSGVWKLL